MTQDLVAPAVVEQQAGDGLLLVAVRDGVVDVEAAVLLNSSAQALWRALRSGADEPALVAVLTHEHARSPAAARAEASAFLTDLRARGLVPGAEASALTPTSHGLGLQLAATESDHATLRGHDVVALARSALARGHRVRFCARGLSMRPQVPHGSVLEVVPRAFAAVRTGDIVLYASGDAQLVAHRVLRRDHEALTARGDSAARVDRVPAGDVLGVVAARVVPAGRMFSRVALDTWGRRMGGQLASARHRVCRGIVRVLVVHPLRSSGMLRRWARRACALFARLVGGAERRCARWRRRLDVATAVLTTSADKDARRRALYARASVRAFTALDENVEAGLTLIEEVMLARHPLPPGDVLVLGCGPGRECVAFARQGKSVTGLDFDAGMLAAARDLAARNAVDLHLLRAEADAFDLGLRRFGAIVALSGLYNMLLPRARRVAMLRCAAQHLAAHGRAYLTFLSDYWPPGVPPPPEVKGVGRAIDPDYQAGDLWLRNEAVHIFPHSEHVRAEAAEAGLRVTHLFRDQRAYDRATRQVRGYVVLAPAP